MDQRFKQIQEEQVGAVGVNDNIVCIGCIFANGKPPFEDTPYKSNCAVYSRDEGKSKPNEVYFDGKPCRYRRDK